MTTAAEPVTSVSDALAGSPGHRVCVQGWVRTRRDSKAGLSFINLNDGSCFGDLQVVAPSELANYESEILHVTTGASVRAVGELVESKGKGQSVELKAESIEVVGFVDDPDTYPVPAKRHTFEYLREQAHLRVRTNTFGAVARVRHCLAKAIHDFFHDEGFYWVHTPIITASDCEGAGEMFRVSTLDAVNRPVVDGDGGVSPERTPADVRGGETPPPPVAGHTFADDFFGKEAFLTVSGQLNVETYACALGKVYTFGPTFRAENSNTSRHLAEFWMIEPEIAFADLSDNIDLGEALLKFVIARVLRERADDMAFFDQRIEPGLLDRLGHVVESSFRRLTYTEAIEILEKSGKAFEYPVEWGSDLQSEHERYLTEDHFKQPVVLINYPKQIKAFYMRMNEPDAQGRETVAAMDVLVPGIGEIIGGAQREERLDMLDRRLDEQGLEKAAYWWYRDLRKYGTVPHAGFGLGFERLIMFITGMANVRDVIPFPRTPRNAEF
ncbi:MAG: asparagine--tRNA ligase [Planctomycetota bacterium]